MDPGQLQYSAHDMEWELIEKYDIYNIKLIERKTVKVVKDQKTGEEKHVETDVDAKDPAELHEHTYLQDSFDEDGERIAKPRTTSTIYTFDVRRDGEYLGVPRIRDIILDAYRRLGIDIDNLRPDEKVAYCHYIDTKMRRFWDGIVGNWITYKQGCVEKDGEKMTQALVTDEIQTKEEVLHGEVPVTQVYQMKEADPKELRRFFDDRIENDYFFKDKTIEKAPVHPRVRSIKNILERDEESMDHELFPEILDRKGPIPWVEKAPKYLDLYKCD